MLSVACLSVSADTFYQVGNWVYEKINNETEFEVDEYIGSATTVVTPTSHNDIPITSIGEYAFRSNTTLKTINLRTPVTAVQNFAFTNCTNLNRVIFNSDIDYIGAGAFSGCTALTTINLENTAVTAILSTTFKNCDSLTEVALPDTVTSIGNYSFSDCDSLSKITIPASVTSISDNAFYDTSDVVIYCYSDSTAHTYAQENDIDFVLLDAVAVDGYILGDADDDGVITVLDATTVQRILASLDTDDDGKMSLRGDVDQDEILSIMDATYIQRYVAAYDDGLAIGNTFEY